MRELATTMLGSMNLYAPEGVREIMRKAATARADFTRAPLDHDLPVDQLRELWHYSWEQHRELRRAIRRDLKLGDDSNTPD